MQLEKIVIYNSDGRLRTVNFRVDKLNIVSGTRRRGKSALLEIVDYCFGRREFTVPAGVIRDHVAWYGVRVIHGTQRTWLLRPAPTGGQQTTAGMMLVPGASQDPPSLAELATNADRKAAREHLSTELGIEAAEIPREGGEARLRGGLRVSVAQAILFCLQTQNEITSKTQLFHRQEEREVADDLRAAFPYFLGAVPPEVPQLRSELNRRRRELRQNLKRLEIARAAEAEADQRVQALVADAEAAGFALPEGPSPLARLERAEPTPDDADARSTTPAGALLARRETIAEERVEKERVLLNLRKLEDEASSFATQASEEGSRLHSLELLPKPDDVGQQTCPLCGTSDAGDHPSSDELRAALERLNAEIADATGFSPRVREEIERQEAELQALDDELKGVSSSLAELAQAGDQLAAQRDRRSAQAFVRGKISEYVRIAKTTEAETMSELEAKIAELETGIEDLEDQLDEDSERERVDVELDRIARKMTAYGRALEAEHVDEDSELRLNIQRLTTVIRTEKGPIWQRDTGSGTNHVGYHLAAHLGLHGHFLNRDLPVPSFLMLDQPTQAYYPETYAPGEIPDQEDLDPVLVREMFRVLYEAVDAIEGKPLQIIVCDHAKLHDQPWFMECLDEDNDWRGDKALIPADWL
jgi:hypothetical protein